jgi:hypothetical protein
MHSAKISWYAKGVQGEDNTVNPKSVALCLVFFGQDTRSET